MLTSNKFYMYQYYAETRRKSKPFIYTGYTENLERRLKEHRYKKRIKNIQLIWFEIFDNKTDAFNRERNFKRWSTNFSLSSIEHKEKLKYMLKNNQKLDLFDKIINQESLLSKKISNCNIKHQNNVGILF